VVVDKDKMGVKLVYNYCTIISPTYSVISTTLPRLLAGSDFQSPTRGLLSARNVSVSGVAILKLWPSRSGQTSNPVKVFRQERCIPKTVGHARQHCKKLYPATQGADKISTTRDQRFDQVDPLL